ncbi:hypothetical protein BC829DRAFT_396879 [Chytridium lagenaria]|nr:hypothetical protein BC829DRAFT_396879 [Chytridium lagenaria]
MLLFCRLWVFWFISIHTYRKDSASFLFRSPHFMYVLVAGCFICFARTFECIPPNLYFNLYLVYLPLSFTVHFFTTFSFRS